MPLEYNSLDSCISFIAHHVQHGCVSLTLDESFPLMFLGAHFSLFSLSVLIVWNSIVVQWDFWLETISSVTERLLANTWIITAWPLFELTLGVCAAIPANCYEKQVIRFNSQQKIRQFSLINDFYWMNALSVVAFRRKCERKFAGFGFVCGRDSLRNWGSLVSVASSRIFHQSCWVKDIL